jgi:hypothetical protein
VHLSRTRIGEYVAKAADQSQRISLPNNEGESS